MPTLSKVTDSYQNEPIECAKIVFDEPGSYKFAHIVNAATSYEFQMVAKAAAATTLTIECGDTTKTVAITTSWDRYILAFPNVTNSNDSLYITCPTGTYYFYNLQLERAKNPSGWRPAPEDAYDYANQVVDSQTQLDIFNKLTNGGQTQGLYLYDGKVYINADYLKAGTINANDVAITNLITDHLRSFGNADTWQLDSMASYLDLRSLISSIWKQRVGIYINNADGGSIRCSSGDVDANGAVLGGTSYRTFIFPSEIRIGVDKDGNYTGVLNAGSISANSFTSPAIGTLKASSVLSTVGNSWEFDVTGCHFLLIKGTADGYRNMVVIANSTDSYTFGSETSSYYIKFKCTYNSSTHKTTVEITGRGSSYAALISCHSII